MAYCPNCGKSVPDNVVFCPSCGKSISTLTGSPQPQPASSTQPMSPQSPKSRTLRNVGIVVVVVVVAMVSLIIIGAASASTVNITAQNLSFDYTGSTSGYFGPSFQGGGNSLSVGGGSQFTETITPTNGALLLTHSINSISVTTPGFTLVTISPNLPYSLTPGSSITFTLTIQAPNTNYNGPIGILISTS